MPQAVFKNRLMPILLLLPTLIILAFFLYYPMFETVRQSTLRSLLGLRERYVGLDNYVRLLVPGSASSDAVTYYQTLVATLIFSALIIGLGLGAALAVALLASQRVRGIRFYRTLLIWPYALSPAIAGAIFLFLFTESTGVMAYLAQTVFHTNPPWLSDSTWAPIVVAIASIWKALGYNVVFYIAGLQTIPRDVLEAAAIDGATAWQRFWRVVWPLLSPFTLFLVITNISYAFFDTFSTVSVLTGGNANTNTQTLMFKIYNDAFVDHKTGPAAAQSVLLFVMVAAITVVQLRTNERRVTYGA